MQDITVDLLVNINKDILTTIDKVNAGVEKLANQNLSGVNNGIGKFSLAIIGLNQAITLAGKALDYLKFPITEALEAEKAEALLANALRATAGATEETFNQLNNLADALSRQTGIEDEAILNAERFLVQMDIAPDKINEVTKAVIDYSVATGKDLQSASEQVGRVIEGSANTLGRFKLGLSETSTQAERTAAVLQFMNDKGFSGAAAANANTFGGSLAKIGNGFLEIVENVGKFITQSPTLIGVINALGKAFYWVASIIKDIILPAFRALERFIVSNLLSAIGFIIEKLSELFKIASNLPKFLGGDLFKSAVDPLQKAADSVKKFAEEFQKIPKEKKIVIKPDIEKTGLDKIFEDISKGFSFANIGKGISAIGQGAAGANKLLGQGVSMAANAFIPGAGEVAGPLFELFSKTPEEFKKAVQGFFDGLKEVIPNIIENIPVFFEELITFIQDKLPEIVDKLNELFSREEFWQKVVGVLTKQLTDPLLWYRVSLSAQEAFIKAIPDIATAFGQALVDKFNELTGNIGGGISSAGGAVGGFISSVGDFLGFAEGGIVPDRPKFNGDRFPARLSAGERVLTKDQNQKLERFLDGQGQMATVSLYVGESELASVLLNLNQKGFRTA